MTKFLDAAGITRLVGGIINEKEYYNLETTNKTISGAINELKRAGTYTQGDGINISNDTISVDTNTIATKSYVDGLVGDIETLLSQI